jgi:protein-S-isoprenylcysteine O-methyltransferase Ste14
MAGANPHLRRQAFGGLAFLAAALGVLLFLPAGTLRWTEGWVLLTLFSAASLAITLDLMKRDPQLLARRVRAGPAAEKERRQKIIQLLASVSFAAVIAVPALDHRWSWSRAPLGAVVAGDLLVAGGFWIVFRVFRENSFTSAVIEVDREQAVVQTGPYAFVRHPMYAGGLLLLAGIPLALGSYWGLVTLGPMAAVIVWRLLDEETFLSSRLPGYDDYRRKTRYRLIPRVW